MSDDHGFDGLDSGYHGPGPKPPSGKEVALIVLFFSVLFLGLGFCGVFS